jgi:ABC-type branched-subunit amino acid transport system substrate-binding protein
LALFDQNDDRIVLLPRDTKGTPQGAEEAARAALNEGVQIILGPLFAQSVTVVGPMAQARGVPLITFSNDRSVAGPGIYVFGLVPGAQVERVVGLAIRRGLLRLAVLAPDSPYGRTTMSAAASAAQRLGGQVVISQSYPPEQADLSGLVRRFTNHESRRMMLDEQRKLLLAAGDEISRQTLRRLEGIETLGDAGFDALLLPEGGARLRALAPLFPYYDIDPKKVRFLGTWLWGEPGIGSESALVGGWFATPPPDLARRFNQRFQASYGRAPPRLASLGYDAVALIAALARDNHPQPFRPMAFADPSGFAGYNGIFRFTDNVAERGLAVVEVQANNWRVIDPAPTTFQTPVN